MQVLRLNEEFQDEEIREGYKEIWKMKSTMYAMLQASVAVGLLGIGKSLRTAARVAVVVMDVLLSVSNSLRDDYENLTKVMRIYETVRKV